MKDLNTRAGLLETVRGLRDDLERVVAEAGEERIEQSGSFGELSCKDVIAHLTSWRLTTAARLEAGLSGEEPVFPWPAHLNEDEHTDEINRWFFETNHDKPVAEVLRESRETFDRVERAIATLPEDALFVPDRFPWLQGYTLGPAVVHGTFEHYRVDHEPAIRAWLARDQDNNTLLTLIADLDDARLDPIHIPDNVTIRPCHQGDIEALGRLYYEAYDPGVACDSLAEAVADIRATFDGEYGELWPAASFVVEHAGELAAAILTVRRAPWDDTPDCPFIIELFTARAHRRLGLARVAVARCMAAARHAGETAVALRVDAENHEARTLYGSLGFRTWQG